MQDSVYYRLPVVSYGESTTVVSASTGVHAWRVRGVPICDVAGLHDKAPDCRQAFDDLMKTKGRSGLTEDLFT